jgi:hypothetical protein
VAALDVGWLLESRRVSRKVQAKLRPAVAIGSIAKAKKKKKKRKKERKKEK